MKTPIALLCFIIIFPSIAKSQSNSKLLKKAWRQQSTVHLDTFFARWERKSPAISDSELSQLDDTTQQVYRVFEAFYKPDSLVSYRGERGVTGGRYSLVQDHIRVHFVKKVYHTSTELKAKFLKSIDHFPDSAKEFFTAQIVQEELSDFLKEWLFSIDVVEGEMDSIITKDIYDFRPYISYDKKKVLHRRREFTEPYVRFLKEKRQSFIQPYLKVWEHHWGRHYWEIDNHPYVQKMTFDEDIQYVRIFFKIVYGGGEATLKREGETWRLIASRRTWIE